MEFRAIGLMSGTSLDGLDLCFAKFSKENNTWNYEILQAETLPYSDLWDGKLRNSINLKAEELFELHSRFGFFLAQETQEFIAKYSLKDIDVIASHGHTVFHQPEKKYTVQIGDGKAIKILTKIPVVYDFRSQDVLLGGNGAPLVPIGDELLFSEYDACINLGGFSNISYKEKEKRMAFDICPVNIVLNYFAKYLGKDFDENGTFAKAGKVNLGILEKLNSLEYYHQIPPKSLGIEWVNDHIFPKLRTDTPENNLATFTEHVAFQIANIFEKHHLKKVLFTGGGTYNAHLLERIRYYSDTEIIVPEKEVINFKEALIFAFMGVLKLNNEINVLSSATGSSEDHITGILV